MSLGPASVAKVAPTKSLPLSELANDRHWLSDRAACAPTLVRLAHRASAPRSGWVVIRHRSLRKDSAQSEEDIVSMTGRFGHALQEDAIATSSGMTRLRRIRSQRSANRQHAFS